MKIFIWITSTVFLAAMAATLAPAIDAGGGGIVYALDDAFIHMGMAKNLAVHGVYGSTPYEFSSSSSSPLWTLLIAGIFAIAGVNMWAPLVLNALFIIGCIIVVDRLCDFFKTGPWRRLIACLAVPILMPGVPLAFSGMEHVMHSFWTLLLLLLAARAFAGSGGLRGAAALGTIAALAVATRYESWAVIAPLMAVALVKRRRAAVLSLLVGGALPVIAYGIVSTLHGGFFLPNSIVLKTHYDRIDGLGSVLAMAWHGAVAIFRNGHLAGICIAMPAIAFISRSRGPAWWVVIVFLAAVFAHATFASLGFFYRYEAYLVAAGAAILLILPPRAPDTSRGNRVSILCAIMAILALVPVARRAVDAQRDTIAACRNIFEQQVQIGRFIRDEFPAGTHVALNDLGAISFLSDSRILDLIGIASIDIARERQNPIQFTTASISSALQRTGTELLVVHTNLFYGRKALPGSLLPVETWTISNNVICADDTVTIFAMNTAGVARISAALDSFDRKLPPSVAVRRMKRQPAGEM